MSEDLPRDDEGRSENQGGTVSRRHMLLAGTALAASGLSGGAAVAQA